MQSDDFNEEFEPELDGEPEEPGQTPVALAATQDPVQLRAVLVADERTPEGLVCMGTFRDDRMIARCVLPVEAWEEIEANRIFADPVPVVLVAQEAPPGLQCRLFAIVPIPEDGAEEEPEPWAESVPGAGYEAAVAEGRDEGDAVQLMPLPLGHIVRFDRDRVHPDSLPREAMDVLRKIIDGRTSEIVDRALADLLDL